MKKNLILLISTLIISINNYSQSPCVDGLVAGYPCENVDLWSFLSINDLGGGGSTNDIWGWVDPNSNREFALVGMNNGTAFVEITDPENPIYLGKLPKHTSNSTWRDVKVFNNYAFIVSEAGAHGMQIFDLTQLLSVLTPPQTFLETAHYSGFGSSHNVAINEETGYAYSVGDNTFSGGLHIVDINDPINPVLAGGFSDDGYTHDCQAVVYNGPDANYAGKEIVFAANEDNFAIVDVDDKTDIELISSTTYEDDAYTHQCWLTPDHKYLLFGDELDESQNLAENTRTYVYDVSDLSAPVFVTIYEGPNGSIDHNLYTVGNLVYMSNYRSGLRIVDAGGIETGNLIERAFFDCYPANDGTGFDGTWSNYPYFPSGNVVLTGIDEGLFVVRPQIFQFSEPAADIECVESSVSLELNIPSELTSTTFSLSIEGLDGASIAAEEINIPGLTDIEITDIPNLPDGITHFQIILNADYGNYIIPTSIQKTGSRMTARTYLQGPFDEDLMVQTDLLRQSDFLPLEEPFTDLGFNHINGGQEETTSGVINEAGNDAIVDWIFVELRDGDSPEEIIATQSALLQKDGDIVDINGNSTLNFNCISSESVFVALRHKNHLGIRSRNTFSTEVLVSTDFTSPLLDYLGDDKMIEVNGVRLMIAGDSNNDGQINPVDKNNSWRIENGMPFGYFDSLSDFNLDGIVNPIDKNIYWRTNNSLVEELE